MIESGINTNCVTGPERDRYFNNLIASRKGSGVDFSAILQAKTEKLNFSVHAQTRLKSRNIEMTGEIMDKLGKAVEKAERKGSRDSLIILADKAFIVNIPNRTVITAMDGESIRDNVFTNIDSTVIAG